ncbi:MAG TPA: GDSL-type esterase/lipase family protein [Dermatophilaceae bacterium]|nr:GDSL-type esterase/lipase family protein [Dermatophilaceae bacterium]
MTFVDHFPNDHSQDSSTEDVPTEFNPSAEFHVNEGPRDIALVFIGDAYVAGYGDPKGLGWVSRVVGRTAHGDVDITAYQLGVRDETSADVLARWRVECPPRWKGHSEKRLVVAVGHNDAVTGMSTARVRLNLANILDDAAASGVAAFAVGPTPTLDADLNARLEVVVEAQADVCARRGVPYVDCYRPLIGHEQWLSDLGAAGGVYPGQAGYGLIAWLMLHGGWDQWLDLGR